MSKISWTQPQQWAIEDRGGSLLVSAAAGSGKTAVLVERVVSLISDEKNPIDINRLLIVTFSNAAAAEMRQRIGLRLSQLVLENPENYHLQKQQNLLSSAPIKTIHAFCLDLIRENFQNLPITPDFTIMDEKELELMQAEAVAIVIENFYQQDTKGEFAELVDQFSSSRDDRRLIETVYKIYDFARSHPFYEDWLDRKLEMYSPTNRVEETPWGKTILENGRETLSYCLHRMEETYNLVETDEQMCTAYLPMWQGEIAQLRAALNHIENQDWDGVVGVLRNFSFDRLGRVTGENPDKEVCLNARNYVKKEIADLEKNFFNATSDEFKDDIKDLQPKISLLFDLVKEYGNQLDQLKRSQNKLYFSDLEHYALQLLIKKEGDFYKSTPEGEEISSQFDWVLVDEYQDTNEVRDLLFTTLSGGGERLFMVGDVKQSIYSFRLAMPEIFMTKKKNSTPYNGVTYPANINLDTNFRSRQQVTSGVNHIFTQIMSEEIGEINYDDTESLKCGASYPENHLMEPELLLLWGQDRESADELTRLEANMVAKRIKQMLESGFMVSDKGIMRPAVPGDFCILMRSPSSRAQVYVKALEELQLTARADSTSGFLEMREIAPVINLLMAIDNPLLDIELVGAMLSPMFSFTDDDLAEIRLEKPKAPFYLAVQKAAENGNEKCKNLIDVFNKLRFFAATNPVDKLLLEIYKETNWIEICTAMPFSQGRKANLLLLVEYASHYTSIGYRGLAGFVGLLERIISQGGNLDGATITADTSNEIQIISVHRSKGLEFPVVFLCDTGRMFNKQDLREGTLLHSDYGFACRRRNPDTMSQYNTIPMGAIRYEMLKTLLSEEMRILYVALTRAKEKLIISGSTSGRLDRLITDIAYSYDDKGCAPKSMIRNANSYLDWILMAMLSHPNGEQLRDISEVSAIPMVADDNSWNIQVITPETDEESQPADIKLPEFISKPDEKLTKVFENRLDFEYPYESRTMTPNKLAVSQVVEKQSDFDFRFVRRPKFLSDEKLSPTEKGNAMHKFMQFANYENARDNLEQEINRMEKDEFISKVEADSLSRKQLETFFNSALGERIFNSDKVYRELRFITEFGKEQLGDIIPEMDSQSKVLVQGIADLVFIEDGKAFLVDYKTDRIKNMEDLVARYLPQIKIYKRILEDTLSLPVEGCILYSFALSSYSDIST